MMDWDEFFINLAISVADKSKDRSTQVGCVIAGEDNEVLSVGYNGFPRGVNDDIDERHDRPTKYFFTEHAERNAIYNAARQGVRLKGSTLYLNYDAVCLCPDCARAVVQAGIKEVRGPDNPFPSNPSMDWEERFKYSKLILSEGGVTITTIKTIKE